MCEQLYLTDDRLLFDKIRGGNAKAFEYAFRKFSPRLEAFAQKYTNDTNEAEDKEAFVLSRLNGLKNREIAEHMAITEKVVEKHITRALKRFRDGLRRCALLLGTLLSLWKW